MPKKVAIGVVTSDKTAKTRRVEIARKVKHPKYGKIIRKRTVCYVHDEQEESGIGGYGRDRGNAADVQDQAMELSANCRKEPSGGCGGIAVSQAVGVGGRG